MKMKGTMAAGKVMGTPGEEKVVVLEAEEEAVDHLTSKEEFQPGKGEKVSR